MYHWCAGSFEILADLDKIFIPRKTFVSFEEMENLNLLEIIGIVTKNQLVNKNLHVEFKSGDGILKCLIDSKAELYLTPYETQNEFSHFSVRLYPAGCNSTPIKILR